MTDPRATIDGRPVRVRPGDTILGAAARAGIEIPALCHRDGLSPEGGCRLCLVERDGAARPVAACHTPLAEGAAIRTATPRLLELRRAILELELSAHPPGTFHPDRAGTEVEALAARLGVAANGRAALPRQAVDASHPYLRFQPDLCVTCRRCLHACEEVQGQFVYSVDGRGGRARLVAGPTERFADGDCVACGACVDVCPTGAVTDRDRLDAPAAERVTHSVCGYCGVGCRVEVASADGRVVRIGGVDEAAVNRGHLCVKGRYAHAHHRSSDRLTVPLLLEGGRHRAIGWDEAIGWLAERLRSLRNAHGADALAALTSARSTNEASYLLQKLFRAVIGTNNVDCCARVCHASSAAALTALTGTGAATGAFDDIERARLIVVVGANPTEAHPVVGARIKQAALRGTPLVVLDPRRIELSGYAALHLQVRPGANVPLLGALAGLLIAEGRIDRPYLAERVTGLEELAGALVRRPLREDARLSGVPADEIRAAAGLIGDAGPTLFVHGLGLSEQTQGVAAVTALGHLALLTGSIGRPGAGMMPLRGQNNVQGAADMGSMPDRSTGYAALDDPEARARLGRLWGAPPPPGPGLTVTEMTAAAERGEIRGMWIQGEDVAQSDPREERVRRALEALDLLVVQEMFLTETARRAHLVLPAAGALEQDGTFTNAERRIQRVRAAVPPPGRARPDWEAVRDVARALGAEWSYADPSAVWDEIALAAPALFGGVSYRRLEGDGLQWPCPSAGHPGTPRLHTGGFEKPAHLEALTYMPSPEDDVPEFPYRLVTGRVLEHYNVGTMTRRTPNQDLTPADVLEVHPDDAEREGLADGGRAALESRWGRAEVRVRRSDRVALGTMFLSFHQPETHANRLVGPHVDPVSKCPAYKVTAVRVRPAA